MRDHLFNFDEKYFTDFILVSQKSKENCYRKIQDGEVAAERLQPLKKYVYLREMPTLLARYSRGDDINDLKPIFINIVKDTPGNWSPEGHEVMLRLLSMGILLNAQEETFQALSRLVELSQVKDWVLNYLLNSFNSSISYDESPFVIPLVYDGLKALEQMESNERINGLKAYLKTWYKNRKGNSWHNTHLKPDRFTYYGYWSLEAGAFSKLLNIDDSSLRSAPYYPYDLLHF